MAAAKKDQAAAKKKSDLFQADLFMAIYGKTEIEADAMIAQRRRLPPSRHLSSQLTTPVRQLLCVSRCI
jgi:hypothetical protein